MVPAVLARQFMQMVEKNASNTINGMGAISADRLAKPVSHPHSSRLCYGMEFGLVLGGKISRSNQGARFAASSVWKSFFQRADPHDQSPFKGSPKSAPVICGLSSGHGNSFAYPHFPGAISVIWLVHCKPAVSQHRFHQLITRWECGRERQSHIKKGSYFMFHPFANNKAKRGPTRRGRASRCCCESTTVP